MTAPMTVLAVDDEPPALDELAFLLRDDPRVGDVATAGDALTALRLLEDRSVDAVVTGHERGKKIRVFKFKPKRGYKRTTGHRQELTRLEITEIKG